MWNDQVVKGRLLQTAAVVTLALFGFACGATPTSRIAAPGSTILIAIPADYPVGYGQRLSRDVLGLSPMAVLPPSALTDPETRAPYDVDDDREDPQRGELVFVLYNDADVFVSYLPARYILKMQADEGSSLALSTIEIHSGQMVAFVDIPADSTNIPPGDYTIEIEHWSRGDVTAPPEDPNSFYHRPPPQLYYDPPGEDPPSFVDWVGWGDDASTPPDPSKGIPIEIVADTGFAWFHPSRGWDVAYDTLFNSETEPHLDDLIPRPGMLIDVWDPQSSAYPAAQEFTLSFPGDKIEIVGVEARGNHRSSVHLAWQQTPPDIVCTSPLTDRCRCYDVNCELHIQWLDPAQRTAGLEVVYRLRGFETTGPLSDAWTDAPTIETATVRTFDANGNALTGFALPERVSWDGEPVYP